MRKKKTKIIIIKNKNKVGLAGWLGWLAKVLTTKPEHLSYGTGTHMLEGDN